MPTKHQLLIRAGVALAALALVNQAVAGISEYRHPARGRFVKVDGVRLHYLDQGVGMPIVLLHGNGAMAEDWVVSGVFGRLVAAGHRVIAFDRPGFGYTTRPRGRFWTASRQALLIAAAMRQLDLPTAVVVGHSWGSIAALELALQRPEQVSRLVLLSGLYYPEARMDVAMMTGTAAPVIGDIIANTLSPPLGWLFRNKVFRSLFRPAPVTWRFDADFPLGLSLRPGQIRASAKDTALMIPAAAALDGRRAQCRVPTSIAAGPGDQVVDFGKHSARLHAELPGSRLLRLEGAGHMVHHTDPAAVSALILDTSHSR